MQVNRSLCYGLVWALLLVISTLAAPVIQTDKKDTSEIQPEVASPQKTDITAEELEGLLQNDETIEKSGEDEDASPPRDDDEDEEERPSSVQTQVLPEIVPPPSQPMPAKRQMPAMDSKMSIPLNSLSDLQNADEAFDYQVPREYPTYQQEEQVNSLYGSVPDVDLSPRAVAEYLLVTKDFSGFDGALADLVQSGVLTPDEVYQYKATVSWQYEDLMRQVEEAEQQYLQDLSRADPINYLEQNYMRTDNVNSLPSRNMPRSRLPLTSYLQAETLPLSNVPVINDQPQGRMDSYLAADPVAQQYQDYGIQAIPIAERRTERIQKLLLAKQQDLNGILDVVLNEFYTQPQETTYNTDYLDTLTSSLDVNNDPDLAQLMEYIQESSNTEEPQQQLGDYEEALELPQGSEKTEMESPVQGQAASDVANELEDLPVQHSINEQTSDNSEQSEETSGDEEDRKLNETKVKVMGSAS